MYPKSNLQQQFFRTVPATICLGAFLFTATESMHGQRVTGSHKNVNTQLLAMATNPATNRVYLVGNGIVAIDGATGRATTINDQGAQYPVAVAVNPVTNRIYVANNNQCGSGGITVIEGETNAFKNIPNGATGFIAVNPATNKIYASDCPSGISVVDGATNAVTVISEAAGGPLAVNPLTDKIYVAAIGSIIVIDGATNATTTITCAACDYPNAVAVDSASNKIYVAIGSVPNGGGSNAVAVIDGATNVLSIVADPKAVDPVSIAVNPVNDKITGQLRGVQRELRERHHH